MDVLGCIHTTFVHSCSCPFVISFLQIEQSDKNSIRKTHAVNLKCFPQYALLYNEVANLSQKL